MASTGARSSKRWFLRLHWQVALAMVLAVPVGLIFGPRTSQFMAPLADLFLRLLKMLVVPLIAFSIVAGVSGIGNFRGVGRLGLKTFSYYVLTTLAAILTGLLLVNLIHPGNSAIVSATNLGDSPGAHGGFSPWDLVLRLVPENPVEAMVYSADDPHRGPNILGVIFFSILFGLGILSLPDKHRTRLTGIFQALFSVMMKITDWVIKTAPIGVFALLVDTVATTGIEAFEALGLYMLTVLVALLIHFGTLSALCFFVGKRNPWRFFRAMSPALATAFSCASSNAALPLTIDSIQKHAGVSNRTASFVLPLGATVNMDGTALYECVAVLFIAQSYGQHLGATQQFMVVITALLASVGAAGIPHAGLVMMSIVLGAVGLPLEGVGMILAVDRILDMCRTSVNVFSDSVGAACVARLEGEPVKWPTEPGLSSQEGSSHEHESV